MYIVINILTICSTCLAYDKVHCNTYPNNQFDMFNYYLLVIYFTALLSSLGMMTGKVMARSYMGGLKDMALSTRQFVV